MANTAVAFGAMLIALGLISYFGTGTSSYTALIPSGFGVFLAILGLLARDPGKTKHAMHAAAVFALFGLVASVTRLIPVLTGSSAARPAAVISQGVMAVLMLIFLILCVQSFRAARRSRVA